jgi:hypothetical protein
MDGLNLVVGGSAHLGREVGMIKGGAVGKGAKAGGSGTRETLFKVGMLTRKTRSKMGSNLKSPSKATAIKLATLLVNASQP